MVEVREFADEFGSGLAVKGFCSSRSNLIEIDRFDGGTSCGYSKGLEGAGGCGWRSVSKR